MSLKALLDRLSSYNGYVARFFSVYPVPKQKTLGLHISFTKHAFLRTTLTGHILTPSANNTNEYQLEIHFMKVTIQNTAIVVSHVKTESSPRW